jgi:N-carbamoyl-L-amino-acid hydrolase
MTSTAPALQPQRTVAELKELRALTGDEHGAQRVAFTPTWAKARQWLRDKLAELPVEVKNDPAGNLWATLRGESDQELLIGGHLDSVPNGGWLDGCLNVVAGLEVLRRFAAEGKPPVTIRLVDWADEEGARFGRSLFGSSAASGSLVPMTCATSKTKTASASPTRCGNMASKCTWPSKPASNCKRRRRISNCTSSRGRCSKT